MRLALIALFVLPAIASGQVWEKTISPGLTYRMEVDAKAPRIVHALRVSLGAPGIQVTSELAGGTINEDGTVKGRLTTSKMREQAGATAALNGDFFSYAHGAPIGFMVRQDELITTPIKARSVFAWGKAAAFGEPTWSGTVMVKGVQSTLDAINQPPGLNQLDLYTAAVGDLAVPSDATSVVLKIDSKLSTATKAVPVVDRLIVGDWKQRVDAGQWVLVARGTKAALLNDLRPGDSVPIQVSLLGMDWANLDHAVGGGPTLLQDGTVAINATQQGFNAAFVARNPRTAVGRTAQGDIWFVAIDGRQPMSVGASLEEEAKVMQDLGCTDAINLDGGGSTNLNLLGVTLNRPSDKVERPVSNGILIFTPKRDVSSVVPKLSAPDSVKVGKSVDLKLMLVDVEASMSEVIWGCQGAAWIDQGGTLHPLEGGKAVVTAYWRGQMVTKSIDVQSTIPAPKPGKGSGGS